MIRLQPTRVSKAGGFMNPAKALDKLDIKKGIKVADFGCGAGYFTIPIARKVGKGGKVHAIDILDSALESVRGRAKIGSLLNIDTHKGNLEKEGGSGLEDKSVDMVILANILFQSKLKDAILNEAKRILKDEGRIVIIEWNDDAIPGSGFLYRIPKEELKDIVKSVGFVRDMEFDAEGSHYGLVFSL